MGNNIKKLRKEQGLSIRKLSELTGISAPTLSRYENGDRHPKIENWQKLADFFEVSIEYLQGKTFINKESKNEGNGMKKQVRIQVKDTSDSFLTFLDEKTLKSLDELKFITFDDVSNKVTEFIVLNTSAIGWIEVYNKKVEG